MPNYTLLFTGEKNGELDRIECVAPNPWLALEKSRKAIGHNTIELREGNRSFGRFRHGLPGGGAVWEVSPHRN